MDTVKAREAVEQLERELEIAEARKAELGARLRRAAAIERIDIKAELEQTDSRLAIIREELDRARREAERAEDTAHKAEIRAELETVRPEYAEAWAELKASALALRDTWARARALGLRLEQLQGDLRISSTVRVPMRVVIGHRAREGSPSEAVIFNEHGGGTVEVDDPSAGRDHD